MAKKMVKLDTLKPNESNPRKIHGGALEKLAESIERDPSFMELRPIVVDENKVILGGNQRYQACLSLGKKEVPSSWVKEAKGLTEEQKKRFILVDNSPEGMGGIWDESILKEDWDPQALGELGFDLYELGLAELPEPADDPYEHWKDMPEFEQEDQTSWKEIKVHFANKSDYEEFSRLINQTLTEKTRSIWFPAAEIGRTADKSYVGADTGVQEAEAGE